jgi:hypothetical protein
MLSVPNIMRCLFSKTKSSRSEPTNIFCQNFISGTQMFSFETIKNIKKILNLIIFDLFTIHGKVDVFKNVYNNYPKNLLKKWAWFST